jgi:hypothetical protein
MATLKEEAEFQGLALAMAMTDIPAVIAWADRIIGKLPEPPIQVIDVSLAGNQPANEVMRVLSLVPGPGDLRRTAHQILGLFLERFLSDKFTLQAAVDALWAYSNWADIDEDERLAAGNFIDELNCAQLGHYGTSETVRVRVIEFARARATEPGELGNALKG